MNRPRFRFVLTALALAGALAPCAAGAGLLGVLAEKAKEHGISHVGGHVNERVSQMTGIQIGAAPVALPRTQGFSGCAQLFAQGAVLDVARIDAQWRPAALCASNYAVLHSGLTKSPMLVFERLSRDLLSDALDEQRTDEFYADPRLAPGTRAELSDYAGTGFDRGHMAPAADQPNREAMAQSFVLSNIVPQDPTNNRKIWSKIESDVRKFARRARGAVYVISGPLYRGQTRTIGRNQVWVPTHLFKLVHDEASGRTWAYILPNTATANIEPPISYESFVQQTGWNVLATRAPVALR